MKIQKQADQYPRDDKKSVYTPEQEADMAELAERLRRKREEEGRSPIAFDAEGATEAFKEYSRMLKEKGVY